MLRDLGSECEIKRNDSDVSTLDDADGLVLSGGSPSIVEEGFKLGKTAEYLEKLKVPILGICAGAQFMGKFYGAEVKPAPRPEFGPVTINVLDSDTILKNIPPSFTAWENHNDQISNVPQGFLLLASSKTCTVQAMCNEGLARYGLQFHPEVEHTQHGQTIFRNFLEVCAQR
ncbi:MAG: gamma-glutamyl-gamma-aminobutyrate hydrolase family protein [Thermoplasmatales archaeon]